jgi:hypothetical protein
MTNALAPMEKARLVELEQVVERGLQTFFEVGTALLEIREQRLYRQTHKTFEAYCRQRFGFSDSRGRQLIAAARTVTAVTELGLPAPKTEREARELARRLRAQADELDGGGEERQELIDRAKSLIQQADEQARLAIAEVMEISDEDRADPEVAAEVDEIMARAHALLEA